MLRQKKDGYRGRIEASPRVQEGYKAILSERNNMQAKYDDLMKEYNDQSVRSFEELARDTGFPVLASIPEIISQEDVSARRKSVRKVAAGEGIAVTAGLLIFHFRYGPGRILGRIYAQDGDIGGRYI